MSNKTDWPRIALAIFVIFVILPALEGLVGC